jgi:hypothetical protein
MENAQRLMSLEDLEREDEELADYDIGFQAGQDGQPIDGTATDAWKRGWKDAGAEPAT